MRSLLDLRPAPALGEGSIESFGNLSGQKSILMKKIVVEL